MEISEQASAHFPEGGVKTVSLVVFSLGGQAHALEMHRIRQIVRTPVISPVVEAPDFVDGVMPFRSRVTPVIDLKRRLQIATDGVQAEACVIIVQWKDHPIGLKVDAVCDVTKAPVDAIDAPTDMVGGVSTRFIDGCVFVDDRFLVILKLDEILTPDHLCDGGDPYDQIRGEPDESTTCDTDDGPRHDLRRIVTFALGGERYGANIGDVAEIIKPVPVMPLPNMPCFFLGLINLRSAIVPLIDLRPFLRLGNRPRPAGDGILVVKHEGYLVGAEVDHIGELVRVPPEVLAPPPDGEAGIDAQYLQDMGMVDGRMLTVLNIHRILSDMKQAIDALRHGESRGGNASEQWSCQAAPLEKADSGPGCG